MLMSPQNLPERINAVLEQLRQATAAAGRSAQSVTLLAAGKAQPPAALAQAARCGLEHFGESYLQEALEKIAALRELPLTWHFIGRLQTNKTRAIAENFAWVHGLDGVKIAQRLSAQRPFHAPPLNVCLQVNLAAERTKGGVAPAELAPLAAAVAALPRLKLRGLMCIPPEETEPVRQRDWFARLRVLRDDLNAGGLGLDTLSMGMSADFQAAIAEGSTIVRLGTALFGPRP
jgi:pyridoxal phosphate enzyme (YggS family)